MQAESMAALSRVGMISETRDVGFALVGLATGWSVAGIVSGAVKQHLGEMDDRLRLHTRRQAKRKIVERFAVRYAPAIERADGLAAHQQVRPQIVAAVQEMRRPGGLEDPPVPVASLADVVLVSNR